MAFVFIECILYIYFITTIALTEDYCPKKCACENVASKVKLRCGGSHDSIATLDEINFANLTPNIIKLNLSSNHITNITKFEYFPSLRKLDLSKNKLSFINNEVFINTPDLKQIDLSNNLFITLKQTFFDQLPSLKQIDISNNPLICDCDILWLAENLQNKSIKLLSNPKCTFSKTHKVQFLRKIKPGHNSECTSSPITEFDEFTTIATITTIQLQPTEDQIVFEGDSLRLSCLATHTQSHFYPESKSNISWSWADRKVNNLSDIFVENKYSNQGGIIDSSLLISRINRNHSGTWSCHLTSQNNDKQMKMISVIVISNDTKYCPQLITRNNKGVYSWPKTIIGYLVDLPCVGNPLIKTFYTCSKNGSWINLNTTNCPYISETTRILEQFSKINLTLTKVNVYESALHLKKNYTSDLKLLKDKMDIVFIARTIQNYLEFLSKEKEISRILADIVNNLSHLPRKFIEEADIEDGSCSKLIQSIETVTEHSTTIIRPFYSTQEFRFKRDSFHGLTCTWYTDTVLRQNPKLHCGMMEDSYQLIDADKTMEARIQIPDTAFQTMTNYGNVLATLRLFMAYYADNVFFPAQFQNNTDSYTSVVGVKLINSNLENVTSPISIMMRLHETIADATSIPLPVRWDETLYQGHGGWTSSDCQITHVYHDLLVFQCSQLGYYTILQKITTPTQTVLVTGAKFRLCHPAIYIGGFVLFTTLLTTIVTYLMCYSSIQMAKKAKHSIINTWIAVCLLCFMFTFGIFQTDNFKICQSVGIIIHYLTLSSLLWMCVTVSNMYKRVNKNETTVLTDDGLEIDQPVQKPILGLYLVGWGIALIVCGISGAVNMRDYASHSYCFLETVPSLSALYVPCGILLIFIIIFLLMIRCTIRNTDGVAQLSEGTQGTENVDLDLLEPNIVQSTASVKSTSTRSSMIEDVEFEPSVQLKSHIISLVIYLLAWIFAAISIHKPFHQYFLYEEDLFSILYALFASAFGMFNLFFYCVARNDVRTNWTLARRWFKRKQICFRNRSISDTNQPLPNLTSNQIETQITSRSSSRSSSQPKSVSRQSNNLKPSDLNTTVKDTADTKSNVDLVVLHRQQYRTNNTVPLYELSAMSSVDMFYNPHQSGVARKFFRKQRRHMMKHNNLGPRRRDNGSINSIKTNKSNSDVSSNIFGTSSKVNNTNIHVEQIKECKQKNLNILSEIRNDNEFGLEIRMHKLMYGGGNKRPRKSKINTCAVEDIEESTEKDNMRTVSQQCSLEYSSETLSERILDRDLDLDASVACSDFTDFKVDKETLGKLYVNPMEGILYRKNRDCSLRSSVSTSDVDELYTQIKSSEQSCPRSRTLATLCPDLNDVSNSNDDVDSLENNASSCHGNEADKSETTV